NRLGGGAVRLDEAAVAWLGQHLGAVENHLATEERGDRGVPDQAPLIGAPADDIVTAGGRIVVARPLREDGEVGMETRAEAALLVGNAEEPRRIGSQQPCRMRERQAALGQAVEQQAW